MPMRKNFLILFLVFVYIWSWSIFNESRLPDILEGIAAELRLKSDEKLKCELLKGSPNGCI